MDTLISEALVRRFSVQERNVIVMKGQGYTYKEIASAHNLTPKQVDNTLQKLSRYLNVNRLSLTG